MPGDTGLPYVLPYPVYTDPNDGPAQIQALAEAIDDAFEDSSANITAITSREGASISSTANQTLTSGSVTVLTFDTEDFDNDGMADLVANNDRLTVVTNGFYLVTARASFVANATGNREVRIRRNVAEMFALTVENATAGSTTQVSPAGVLWLQAGDVLQVAALQTSGGNLNVTARHLQAIRTA